MAAGKLHRPVAEAIAAARAARDATIPAEYRLPKDAEIPNNPTEILKTSGILNADELAILDLDVTALAAAIRVEKYTAVQTATAYIKAAALAQQATNCLAEMFAAEALERAQWLDEQQAAGTIVGPLHGVPISIKDHINVKNHDSPSAFLSLVGKMVAKEDAELVRILRDAGAVFYCKTTNPQSLMHLETESYLGITTCPFNRALSAGGSSGGEGALIGFHASPMGVGTDIGGSIRSPAANCGVHSFKPSAGRLPDGGLNDPTHYPGDESVLCTHGPMGRSVRDMELYMSVVLGTEPWLKDPHMLAKPWGIPTNKNRKLRIGVLYDDGVVRPVKPVRRALDATVGKLRASGNFEIAQFKPYKSAENWDILSSLYWPDNGELVRHHLAAGNEPPHPLTTWILPAATPKRDLKDMHELVARRNAFRTEFAAYWRASGVDAVLSPVGPTPAPPHRTAKYWGYTSFWNLVNYPAGVLPTGMVVDPEVDREEGGYVPRNDREREVYDSYDAEVARGAPLGLQVIGYVGLEEEALEAFRQIDEVVNQ